MKRVLREPLFYIFLLGGVIFLFYQWNAGKLSIEDSRHIVVSEEQVQNLKEGFLKFNQRNPTSEEIQYLVDHFVLEEMLYRNAIALGLNKNDAVIRQHLSRKMELILEESIVDRAFSDADLRHFFNEHQNEFREEPKISFIQIFFHKGNDQKEAEALLKKLRMVEGEPQISLQATASLLEPEYQSISYASVGEIFGIQFANELTQLPSGKWQGPINSSYGCHLVYIKNREEGRLPPFEKVKENVWTKLVDKNRRKTRKRIYKTLREEYSVQIESDYDS